MADREIIKAIKEYLQETISGYNHKDMAEMMAEYQTADKKKALVIGESIGAAGAYNDILEAIKRLERE